MEEDVGLVLGAEREIAITATRDSVWSLVTDVERFGEWSPETSGVEWLTPPPHGVGSKFRAPALRTQTTNSASCVPISAMERSTI